jgi:hypothetical protein
LIDEFADHIAPNPDFTGGDSLQTLPEHFARDLRGQYADESGLEQLEDFQVIQHIAYDDGTHSLIGQC